MKKRIKLFLAAAIAAIVSVAAGFYSYQATQEKLLAQEQELLLVGENVEALTAGESWFTRVMDCITDGYYSSPIYTCVIETCSISRGNSGSISGWIGTSYQETRYGKYMKCVNGNQYSHCGDCTTDCDAHF